MLTECTVKQPVTSLDGFVDLTSGIVCDLPEAKSVAYKQRAWHDGIDIDSDQDQIKAESG